MTETVNAGNRPNNFSLDIGKDQSVLLTSRHTFHWIFGKYMVKWERKISWMVELACKIRKASLTACIDD
jgi:hypothetical protein